MQIADIVHYVRLEVPGSMDLIIVQAMAATAMDFCTRTQVWNEIQPPIPLRDSVSQYDIDAPTGARAIGVTDVWQGSYTLTPITQTALSAALPEWQNATAARPQFYNVAQDHTLITVYPRPLLAGRAPITLRVRYTPLRTALVLPDFLIDEHLDALNDGCKARLFAQANVPWSNPAAVPALKEAYELALINARIKELHGNVPSSLRVQPRRFG